jgi:hypothetical protein
MCDEKTPMLVRHGITQPSQLLLLEGEFDDTANLLLFAGTSVVLQLLLRLKRLEECMLLRHRLLRVRPVVIGPVELIIVLHLLPSDASCPSSSICAAAAAANASASATQAAASAASSRS